MMFDHVAVLLDEHSAGTLKEGVYLCPPRGDELEIEVVNPS